MISSCLGLGLGLGSGSGGPGMERGPGQGVKVKPRLGWRGRVFQNDSDDYDNGR